MTPATLLRAAALLEREAILLERQDVWAGRWLTPSKRARHDEMLAVAAELRKGANNEG